MLPSSNRPRRDVTLAIFALVVPLLSACAADDGGDGDDDTVEDRPTVNVGRVELTEDPGTDAARIPCAAPKPYVRCNVFGHCRCSAYQ